MPQAHTAATSNAAPARAPTLSTPPVGRAAASSVLVAAEAALLRLAAWLLKLLWIELSAEVAVAVPASVVLAPEVLAVIAAWE